MRFDQTSKNARAKLSGRGLLGGLGRSRLALLLPVVATGGRGPPARNHLSSGIPTLTDYVHAQTLKNCPDAEARLTNNGRIRWGCLASLTHAHS